MKHKKTIIIGVVLLAITFIVMALSNSTYALFSSDAYGNTNAYTTGMLLIEADSKSENILLDNALPMSDEDGKNTTPYIFTIKNIGNLDYEFDVKLLSTGDINTSFSPQYIRLQVDNGDVITLSGLTNGEIKSDITLSAGDSIDISIRVWLSIDTPNSEIGKSFNSKIVTDGKAVYSSSNNVLTAAQYIRSLYNNADKTEVTNNNIKYHQAQSVSLMNDRLGGKSSSYDSGNIRYYGATPDNYIYFNCSDYNNQNDNTCEKWRIIGVFDGKLKLIKDESIGNYAYDDDSNNWSTSTLNTYLNGDYYNSLSKKTRSFISNSTYYLGGYESSSLYANQIYEYERTNEVGTTILGSNPFTEDTNIGLMYTSDYGYATDFKECDGVSIYFYDDPGCYDSDWLFLYDNSTGNLNSGVNQWTITPDSRDADTVYVVNSSGYVEDEWNRVNSEYVSVRPVLYLDADVVFGDKGDGTSDNPYQIYVEPPKLTEHITNLYISGNQELITQTTSNDSYYYSYQDDSKTWGLMNDGLKIDTSLDPTTTGLATTVTSTEALTSGTEGNIRYFGPSDKVNNYIYFNCSDYSNQTDSTCEKWRIIGIVDGKVKIIRNESIGDLAWDQDKNQVSSLTTYNNNWTTSSLQELLNGLYYNRGTIESHPYYSGSGGTTTTTLNLKTIGITEATRNMISETTWYLGGYNSSSIYPNQIYAFERTNDPGTTIYSTNDFAINKNIGLMYPSDYGYGTDLTKCSQNLYNYSTLAACKTNNWLFNSAYQWLITPYSSSSSSAWGVTSSGYVNYNNYVSYANRGVRPVLYLNSELAIESEGDGSSANPYRIIVR